MVRISNKELVGLLLKDSRATYQKLAKCLKVSDTAIRKRMSCLENSKVIRGYTLDVDPRRLGYDIQAIVGIDTVAERYIRIIEVLKSNKKVKKLWRSSGDHMILLEVWMRDTHDMAEFIEEVEKMDGVLRTCPAIIHEQIM